MREAVIVSTARPPIGHPYGMSGARMTGARMTDARMTGHPMIEGKRRGTEYGIVTMCGPAASVPPACSRFSEGIGMRVSLLFRSLIFGLVAMLMAATAGAQPANVVLTAPAAGRTYKVAFTQIIDHAILNATRAGFLEGLKAAGFVEGKNLTFTYLNAAGDATKLRAITDKLLADKPDLLAACTLPNIQAAVAATKGKTTPVVFGCLLNPVENGVLAATGKATGSNLTGFYSVPPIAQMFDLIKQLHPKAKIIGTMYNPEDENSVSMNTLAKAEAVRRGLTWGEVQVLSPVEAMRSVQPLAGQVDTLLMLQDTTVAAASEMVVRTSRQAKIPLFSFDASAVERGAIAGFTQNPHQTGVEWAHLVAVPVLLGKPAGELVPVSNLVFDLLLNSAAATATGVVIPEEVTKSALRVYTN